MIETATAGSSVPVRPAPSLAHLRGGIGEGAACPASDATFAGPAELVTVSPKARMLAAVADMLAEALGEGDAATDRYDRARTLAAAIVGTLGDKTAAASLSLTVDVTAGDATVSVAVALGTASGGKADDAALALRLGGAERSTALAGQVSGPASIALRVSVNKSVQTGDADIRTGSGNDVVALDLSQSGQGWTSANVYTGGGGDTIRVLGSSAGTAARVYGGSGNDTIVFDRGSLAGSGGGSMGIADGGDGDDTLLLHGDVVAEGGGGDDRIDFADGRPVMMFNRGDGHDTVTVGSGGTDEHGRSNLWIISDTLNAADVEVVRDGADTVLRIKATGDSITFRNYDAANGGRIRFGDYSGGPLTASIAPAGKVDLTA